MQRVMQCQKRLNLLVQSILQKGGSRKDAPGDIDPKTGERQKTKPSQYTKKFKQMYGEQEKEPKSDAQKDREEFKKLQKDKKVAQLQISERCRDGCTTFTTRG